MRLSAAKPHCSNLRFSFFRNMKRRLSINWKHFGKGLLLIGILLLFCEVLIYYIVLLQCTWPQISTTTKFSLVKTMVLADPHLLGPKFGHWFDKLRREWQMYRAFQSTMNLHNPQAVFILGDIFDEGFHCSDEEFDNYVKRFHSIFRVPESTMLYVIVGNHDIGFHYRVTRKIKDRFEKAFNISPIDMIQLNGNTFITMNSMALEGDSCFLCKPAEDKLKEFSVRLNCAKNDSKVAECDKYPKLGYYSQPIILQHFPLYRKSDSDCKEPDAAPADIIDERFRETWECLSEESTDKILDLLDPRVVFTGHTHHGCLAFHRGDVPEWTVSSFSWRNKGNPTFLLATFSPDGYSINKCHMPKENSVILAYIIGSISIVIWVYITRQHFFSERNSKNK